MARLGEDPRAARARLEQAADRSRHRFGEADGETRPRRYKLYDRIKGRVSVTTMNVIIAATALLLVLALVYGIVTAQ